MCRLFSTSVELESENVCLCVCPKYFGAAWRHQKWLDLAENFAHLFLGWISGSGFFHLSKFWFLGPTDEGFAKTRLNLCISLFSFSSSRWTLCSKVSLMFCYQMLQSGLRIIWNFWSWSQCVARVQLVSAVADDLWLAFCSYVCLEYLLPDFDVYFVWNSTRSSK